MVTENELDELSRLLGLKLDAILLESDHRDGLISDATYRAHCWRLRTRIHAVSKRSEVLYTLWKGGVGITLPSDPDVSLESNVVDA